MLCTTITVDKTNRNKRVLFDLNHPADFHFFKHLIQRMLSDDYELNVVARDKECLHLLLENAGIPFRSRGRGMHSLLGKHIYAFVILARLLYHISKFRPGLTMSLSSPYLALLSRLLKIQCITFDDTDNNPRLLPLIRLSKYLFSPATYPHQFHPGHFHLPAYKELAYLHPTFFIGEQRQAQAFIRITRTDSVHHSNASILDLDKLSAKILRTSKEHKVILSSELSNFPIDKHIQLANPIQIHKDLSACCAFWGNSATMAAESAVLGIPTVFVGAEKFAYITELENLGLLFFFHPEQLDLSFEKLENLLDGNPAQDHFMKLRQQLLDEKIDMTSFLEWFVKNLPQSAQVLQEQPEFALRFIKAKAS